jgi:cyclophilin family peptidyl-prolyl cis-trans isomerase/FKBP-type peptidyl-prolyl cis-trans isomerase
MKNEDNQEKNIKDDEINKEEKNIYQTTLSQIKNNNNSNKKQKIYENQLVKNDNCEYKEKKNNEVDKSDNKEIDKAENQIIEDAENKIIDNNEKIDNTKKPDDNEIIEKTEKEITEKLNKIIETPEKIKQLDNKINEEIKDEMNENENNEINEDNNKIEQKPKNFGHSKMKVIYGEIKTEALNKSKKKREDKKEKGKNKEEEEKKNKKEKNEESIQLEQNVINEEESKIENVYLNLTADGGIKKKIIKEGKGESPSDGKNVFIFYVSKYKDRIFDQTKKDTIFSFTIGENKVIKGWEIAVKSMKIGEKAEFIMTSDYTYGDEKFNDYIPPKSTLTYEIELIAVNNSDSENSLEKMTYEEKLQWGKLLKREGVEKFKSDDIIGAKECFIKALSFLKTMDPKKEEEKEGVDLYLTTLSNICNCFNKEKEYNSVIEISSIGLKIKLLPKLLYFRAIAYAFTEEFESANNDLDNLSKVLLNESEADGDMNKEEAQKKIDQTIDYIKDIINIRKKIYIEKNNKYSRAIFRQYLYNNKSLVNKPLIPPVETNLDNPFVFFDIKIGEKSAGKIVFELYKNVVPRTAENFRFLCTNEEMTFKGTSIHKIIKNFVIGGGELNNNKGNGQCLYGEYFDDENYTYCHCRRGLLTMGNEGKNKNNSKFLITLKYIPWFDGKHVVFGQIIKGIEIIKEIEEIETDDEDKPLTEIIIENCGEIIEKDEYIIKNEKNKKVKEEEIIKEEKEEKGEEKKEDKKEEESIIKEEKKENEINEGNIIKEEKENKGEEKVINEKIMNEEEKVIKSENEEIGKIKDGEKAEEDKTTNEENENNEKKS